MEPFQEASWAYLSALGKEYKSYVDSGIGLTPESRTPRQVEIASEIVARCIPYLYQIARDITSSGVVIPIGGGRRNVIRIDKGSFSIDDLVSYGAQAVLQKLSKYDESYSMSTFLLLYSAGGMYRAVAGQGIIHIGKLEYASARRVIHQKSCQKALQELEDKCGSFWTAAAMYLNITRKWKSIHDPVAGKAHNSPSVDTFEGRYLKDEELSLLDDLVAEHERVEFVRCLLKGDDAGLTPKEQDVIKYRFGLQKMAMEKPAAKRFCPLHEHGHSLEEIGNFYGVSGERIRQIEAAALGKLRRKLVEM